MVSVIILDKGEPNVIQLTFENLYSELKDIYGSELLIKRDWFDLEDIKNRYVCFVEPDCLVSEGYFKTLLEGFTQKGNSRTTALIAPATSINYWDNKIYGYRVGSGVMGIIPNRKPKSTSPFMVEVAYVPGSIMRVSMLKTIMKWFDHETDDLVYLSSEMSMEFWQRSATGKGKGHKIYLNPNATYLTTENYVNDIGSFGVSVNEDVKNLFARESI